MPTGSPFRRLSDVRVQPRAETQLWRGVDAAGNRAAVKEPRAGADDALRARVRPKIRRETHFLQAVPHPRLLRFVGWEEQPAQAIYEDVAGSVAQLIAQEGRLSPAVTARILRQSLEGLEHLHAAGVGHGGLCPHSLLVTPDGEVKLGDFTGYRFTAGQAPDRPDYPLKYQAPELIDAQLEQQMLPPGPGERFCPPAVRADLYCLGYTAVEMLAGADFDRLIWGRDPVPPEGDNAWLWWHAEADRPPLDVDRALPHVPQPLRAFLRPLLRKHPGDRAQLFTGGVRAALDRTGLVGREKLPAFRPPAAAGPISLSDAEPLLPMEPDAPPPTPRKPARPKPPPKTKGRPVRGERRALVLVPANVGITGGTFPPNRPVVAGRGEGCDLKADHPTLSQRHALFVCLPTGDWWAYDLRSRHGLRVDGKRTRGAALAAGSKVSLGDVTWDVKLAAGTAAPQATIRGTPFGDFILTKRLHEGAAGKVYLAVWPAKKNRQVALRVFPPEFQSDEAAVRRLVERIPEAAKIRHPHIVRLFHAGFYKDSVGRRKWFLAMEHMPGGSLRDVLAGRAGPLDPADAVQFAADTAAALEQATAHQMVHRNINPACVLFDADGRAKLGDFFFMRAEVAASFHQITRATETPGEYVYQSPERLRSDKHLTAASDLYSLAACVYEALTLRPPFDAHDRSLLDVIQSIRNDPPPPPRDLNPAVPEKLNDLIVRALAKNPADRPQTPAEFLKLLEEAAGA